MVSVLFALSCLCMFVAVYWPNASDRHTVMMLEGKLIYTFYCFLNVVFKYPRAEIRHPGWISCL